MLRSCVPPFVFVLIATALGLIGDVMRTFRFCNVGQGSPSTTSPGTPIETWGIEGKVLSGACAPASAIHCTMKHDNAIELLQSSKLNSKSEFIGRSALKQSIILDHDGVGLSKTNLSDCVLRTVSKISIEQNHAVKCPNRPGCS